MSTVTVFSHVGVCTDDLEKSIRFYSEALGFEAQYTGTAREPFDVLTELPGLDLRIVFMVKDGVKIELIHFLAPDPVGETERRPMNKRGLTHLCVLVDDVDAVAELIEAHGGRVYRHTRAMAPQGEFVFCTDPNGVRLELWKKNEDAPF